MSRNSVLTEEQSKINARLEAHMVYICPECGKAFRTQAEWRQHLNTKHDYLKKTYTDFNFIQIDEHFHECQLCFKWVENAHKTIALLQYHYFMHLDHRETYRCVHCRSAYTRRRALNEHLLSTHLQEIEKYEAKVKNVEEKKISKPKGVKPPKKRNDLLQKALMDIDLQLDDPDDSTASDKSAVNTNANENINSNSNTNSNSEQALDRCLTAYEDFVRKEERKEEPQEEQSQIAREEAELDELCKELFEEQQDGAEKPAKPTKEQQHKEVVTIEIDAVGEEEMDKLKMENGMETEQQPEKELEREEERNDDPDELEPAQSKRMRLSGTPTQTDNDFELSVEGLSKLISYLCPTCGKEIVSLDEWRKHVFKKHDFEHFIEDSFQIKDGQSLCLQCREIQHTTKRSELQKHCFKHLPYRSYLKCTLCERTKTSMSKMYHHIRYNHQEELQRKNKTQLLIKPEPKWTASQRSVPEASDPELEQIEPLTCQHCKKAYKILWRFERHTLLCQAAGSKLNSAQNDDPSADKLLQHLRERQLRMNEIWRKMNS